MLNNDVQEIQIDISQAKEAIRLGELVEQLEQVPEFRELIIEGYFKTDAARLVMLKSDPEFQSNERQFQIDRDILGISVFGEYLRVKKMLGIMAADSLASHEATQIEVMQESVQ